MEKIERYVWGLDLSMAQTGIAIFDQYENSIFVSHIKTKQKDSHAIKLKKIADFLLDLKEKYPPDVINIERGFSRFNNSTQVTFRVHGVVNYIFYEYEQNYYPPKEVKEAVTGKGNATKKDVMNVILKKYDINLENEDESDAFAVGLTYFKKGIKKKEK